MLPQSVLQGCFGCAKSGVSGWVCRENCARYAADGAQMAECSACAKAGGDAVGWGCQNCLQVCGGHAWRGVGGWGQRLAGWVCGPPPSAGTNVLLCGGVVAGFHGVGLWRKATPPATIKDLPPAPRLGQRLPTGRSMISNS